MYTDRRVIRKHPKELFMFDTFFKKLTGIELEDIPEEQLYYVLKTQERIKKNTEIVIIYKCENIVELTEDTAVLENGSKYTGEMVPRILKESSQVVTCLITLKGFDKIKAEVTNITEAYFLDAWGSTYVESAQAWLANYLQCELEIIGKQRTHLWSPGQHKFDLSNQRTVFDILQPEEEGCLLTEKFMITPVKTGTGIWGVLDLGAKDLLLPCDYCELADKCPSVKTGCAET